MPSVPFDLFGEIPVTWPEVVAWCERVARIPADSPRLEHYVTGWNVPDKIRAAKLEGTLDAILAKERLEPARERAARIEPHGERAALEFRRRRPRERLARAAADRQAHQKPRGDRRQADHGEF